MHGAQVHEVTLASAGLVVRGAAVTHGRAQWRVPPPTTSGATWRKVTIVAAAFESL